MIIEPISIESIETVDDFFSYLDKNQINDFKAKYHESQPYFADMFFNNNVFSKNDIQQSVIDKMTIVVFICFDKYGYSIPKADTIIYNQLIQKWMAIIKKERKSVSTSKRFKMIICNSNQQDLLSYITDNMNGKLNGNDIFAKEDNQFALSNFLFFIDTMYELLKLKMFPVTNDLPDVKDL
jgi:hypothetical protein